MGAKIHTLPLLTDGNPSSSKAALTKSVTITVEPAEEDQPMESADDILAR
jgi:hypothetical protein